MQFNINQKTEENFLTYAEAVIKSRAISRVEDNLKPVHRRILYTMYESKLFSNSKTVKSAKIVGQVMGLYHPHGDSSIYEAMIRLSQPWKMRYPFVDIQGNKGNIEGDGAAASRYTECKLTPIGELMIESIDKNAVPFKPNYDDTTQEPTILPSIFPNLLCNGNSGIAVGLSSSLVPHNLVEVVDGILAYLNNKNISLEELLKIIKGPDFPTGGTIIDSDKLYDIYKTGSGTITLRSTYSISGTQQKPSIIITEIPYLVDIETGIIEPLKKLVLEEKFDLIEDFVNETNKDGVKLIIHLKKNANIYRVLETLWSKTRLETTQRINNTVIVNGRPVILSLKEMIQAYIIHRNNCIINTSKFDIDKIERKIVINKTLIKAINVIDKVIEIVRNSDNKNDAVLKLKKALEITDEEANIILDIKLSRLTKLDRIDLEKELISLQEKKEIFEGLIKFSFNRENIIKKELIELRNKFGDKRKTIVAEGNLTSGEGRPLELLNVFGFVDGGIMVTQKGYDNAVFGKKIPSCSLLKVTNNKDIVIFTKSGEVFNLKLLTMIKDNIESFSSNEILAIDSLEEKEFVVFVTRNGLIKKTSSSDYLGLKKITKSINLKENDELIYVAACNNDDWVFIVGEENKMVKFQVKDIVATGRVTIGSKGISQKAVCAAVSTSLEDKILTINKDNQGKLTLNKDFLSTVKGGSGQVITEGIIFIGIPKSDKILLIQNNKNSIFDINNLSLKGKIANGMKISNINMVKILF